MIQRLSKRINRNGREGGFTLIERRDRDLRVSVDSSVSSTAGAKQFCTYGDVFVEGRVGVVSRAPGAGRAHPRGKGVIG